jgi:hypothetical protein
MPSPYCAARWALQTKLKLSIRRQREERTPQRTATLSKIKEVNEEEEAERMRLTVRAVLICATERELVRVGSSGGNRALRDSVGTVLVVRHILRNPLERKASAGDGARQRSNAHASAK